MHITLTPENILAFFGAVTVIGGGVKYLAQLLSPFKELKDKLKRHDEMLHNDNERLKKQEQTQEEIKEELHLLGLSMMEIMNHMISGNDVDKLKERYKDMVEHYVEK